MDIKYANTGTQEAVRPIARRINTTEWAKDHTLQKPPCGYDPKSAT